MKAAPIGLLGGTFNPVHFGHLRSALELREQLGLGQVRLIPAAVPPHRELPSCGAELRAEMVELAVASEPGLACDRRELGREGPSYTVDTLLELREELGPEQSLCLIVGTDAIIAIDSWHRWRELIELAHIVVVARPGWALPDAGEVANWLARHLTEDPSSLQHSPSGKLVLQQLRQLPISATEIRQLIADGRSPRYLIPDAVWERICTTGAYGALPKQQEQHGIG
ncbi:MAG: nicotinate-nucleotide adenylyltransferase [Halieaceae bacterium]